MTVRYLSSGDTALVVEFGDAVDRDLNERVLRLSDCVREATLPGVIETVPTFRSLLIHYDPLKTSAAELRRGVEMLLQRTSERKKRTKLWRVPVCYEGPHAPDIAEVAERTGLCAQEVVSVHSGIRFHVYMIGFVPGFPYMGSLPERLILPRRVDPRVRVPAGSVAIASSMTAIYPLESPGGWHLIGSTPIRLFDTRWQPPALLTPGDAVVFEPITVGDFEAIRRAVEAETYQVPCEEVEA